MSGASPRPDTGTRSPPRIAATPRRSVLFQLYTDRKCARDYLASMGYCIGLISRLPKQTPCTGVFSSHGFTVSFTTRP
jgi:hypothetical protein